MGVGPPLPAPTDPSSLSSAANASAVGTDIATDVSQQTEHTSYSIPSDGRPVTISTRRKRSDRDKDRDGKLARPSHHSQTSLLIEYFEGGPGRSSTVQARPSVRVKVTPSAARKIKAGNEQIQISETGQARQPSYSKRISLTPTAKGDKLVTDSTDEHSLSSFASATEESGLRSRPPPPPVEVEVIRDGHDDEDVDDSPMSAATSPRDSRYVRPNPSEISAMPPDSFIDNAPVNPPPLRRTRSRSLEREGAPASDKHLKAPTRRRSRSLSRERITQKVIEKLESKANETGAARKRRSKSRSRSVSKEQMEVYKSSSGGRRRSSGKVHRDEDPTSGAESSRLTASQLSPTRKSGDQYSFRSGTSKSSVNNTRLLETLEDAIRRVVLPELSALKREQTTQRNRTRFEESTRDSMASGSVASREGSQRRIPKVSSAPDVSRKQKVMIDREEVSRSALLSGDPIKRRKERRSSRGLAESPSEKSSERRVSEETLTEGRVRGKRSKDRHGLRDAAGAAVGGALTAAALRHHDSKSSVDGKERHKRRSKSRSRSASLAEQGGPPAPDEVPPMPLSSEINGSDLTRDSILTARTDRPISASQEHDALAGGVVVRDARASVGTANGLQQGGGYLARAVEAGLNAAAAGGSATTMSYHQDPAENHLLAHRRSLSPIQSVASYKEDSVNGDHRDSFLQTRSAESLSTQDRKSPAKQSDLSLESVSTSASSQVAKIRRRQPNTYRQRDSLATDGTKRDSEYVSDDTTPKGITKGDGKHLYKGLHGNGVEYVGYTLDEKRMTDYTTDSLDDTYSYRMAAGQEILGVGANPEYRNTPVGVSSAVASIHNSSVIDIQSNRSKVGDGSLVGSTNELPDGDRLTSSQRGSPARRPVPNGIIDESVPKPSGEQDSRALVRGADDQVVMGASSLPVADDPMPEIGHGLEEESEITTNPSIIRGPIGGVPHGNRDHWPYDPTPPQPNGQFLDGRPTPDDREHARSADGQLLGTATGVGLGADLGDKPNAVDDYPQDKELKAAYTRGAPVEDGYTDGVNHDFGTRHDSYQPDHIVQETPSKDEGYISAAPAAVTPDYKRDGSDLYDDDQLGAILNGTGPDDPFTSSKHVRHLSGNSHGMASPLYDSATGKGIDRIQSKDIVALMDHLTVRDAQRNARDTEILVTLVRSAAEMRNSFEDMKKLLAEQEMHIIDATDRNTERSVQKVINGPRPQPFAPQRTPRRTYTDEEGIEDLPTKRRNVFRRALKGLSMRSSNDLSKIEDMLMQLLGDVESLKAAQEPRTSVTHPNSLNSYENLRNTREGYEPEGQAGTGPSNQSNSGYFSNPPSRQASAMRSMDSGRAHEHHRVSTVAEGDEDLAAQEEEYEVPYDPAEDTPAPKSRGMSLPLESPPEPAPAVAHSSENTPKADKADKSRKHRSTASSIFPKISRWSETTASTMTRPFRSSGRKEREYSEAASRSGSEIDVWHYHQQEVPDDERLRSSYSLDNSQSGRHDNRPPSPLMPQATQEDPKYQAHRDSRNLQHPQPRQGPTQRYQYQLESQAQNFDSPISPTSEHWRSNPSLVRSSGGAPAAGGAGDRRSGVGGHLSPISDAGYSQTSAAMDQAAPPRPPKIAADEPLVPQRPPKISTKAAKMLGTDEQRYSNGSASSNMNGSPRSASGRVQRKPTGPRPISSNR